MFDTSRLGDILVASGLASESEVQAALEHQKRHGGRLGDSLVSLGVVTDEALEQVIQAKPDAPRSIKDVGISGGQLLKYMIKAINVGGLETSTEMKDALKLPSSIINRLLEEAIERGFVTVLGSKAGGGSGEQRYVLSQAGQYWAKELLLESQYVGPAPVSLRAFQERIGRQRITNEQVGLARMREMLSGLVIPPDFVDRLGPAINSGRCILLYGPPGNGKTSVAERIGRMFSGIIYVPYCVEIDGQVMKVFDPSIHEAVDSRQYEQRRLLVRSSVLEEDFDQRWVPCRRPVVVVGGELTLDMLDLDFNSLAKFYEAPLHVKALGGTFIVDDFGRQFVKPTDMLNRWIVPLESRVDFLKLHTGKTFTIPFDELVVFSTNLAPHDLMDPAFLRRIPYKLKTMGPSVENFRTIFDEVSESRGLRLSDEIFHLVLSQVGERGSGLACYQPKFIAEQVLAACKYQGVEPVYRQDLVLDALSNLYVAEDEDEEDPIAAAA